MNQVPGFTNYYQQQGTSKRNGLSNNPIIPHNTNSANHQLQQVLAQAGHSGTLSSLNNHQMAALIQQQKLIHQQQTVQNQFRSTSASTTQLPKQNPIIPEIIHSESSSRCSFTSNYSNGADSGTFNSSPNISPNEANQNSEPDKPIGYGAFGVVWAVTDPRDRQRVALKKMPYVFSNLISAKRVYRELKILSSIRHDNILKALDILLPPENLNEMREVYVVTELLQSDLHKIIVSNQTLTTEHVTIFVYQILRGLKYIHGCGIIHRDIKPGNLLVNSNCLLKICDFGLSREYAALKKADDYGNAVMTQEVVTQYYRPPELLMGADRYNLAVDVWSVGCILVELITRRILFQAPSPLAQLDVMCTLLGKPENGEESIFLGCKSARQHVMKQTRHLKSSSGIRSSIIGHNPVTPSGMILLAESMLQWDPRSRPTVTQALASSVFEDARIRYHTCMCSCCKEGRNQSSNSNNSSSNPSNENSVSNSNQADSAYQKAQQQQIQYYSKTNPQYYEPVPTKSFEFDKYLESLQTIDHVKYGMSTWIRSQPCGKRLPLCINLNSPTFKQFQASTVAQSNELPPSPEKWG